MQLVCACSWFVHAAGLLGSKCVDVVHMRVLSVIARWPYTNIDAEQNVLIFTYTKEPSSLQLTPTATHTFTTACAHDAVMRVVVPAQNIRISISPCGSHHRITQAFTAHTQNADRFALLLLNLVIMTASSFPTP
jgi:hypothetical protein